MGDHDPRHLTNTPFFTIIRHTRSALLGRIEPVLQRDSFKDVRLQHTRYH